MMNNNNELITMPIPSLPLHTKPRRRNKHTNVRIKREVQRENPKLERIKKRKKKNPNKLTPLNHGGGIFFFMQKFVEPPPPKNDNDDDDDDCKNYESESTANTATTDDMINCDLVLKYKPIESPNCPIACDDEGLGETTTLATMTSTTNPSYTSFSDLYGFRNAHAQFDQNNKSEQKRLRLKLKNRDSNIFKPDELGISRSDNNVYRDYVITDKEKRDWWISTSYYDENIHIHSHNTLEDSEPEPEPPCIVI